MKTVWTDKRLQQLFNKYNRAYWDDALPEYFVLLTKDFNGARCEKTQRTILINADVYESDRQVRENLLHEMAHAATNIGHGERWKAEMKRLRSLEATVSEVDFRPGLGRKELLAEFSDAAEQGLTWLQARSLIGREFGLVRGDGRAVDKRVAGMLRIARRLFPKERETAISPGLGPEAHLRKVKKFILPVLRLILGAEIF